MVELVPGGADIPVTAETRGRYVHLMAGPYTRSLFSST